jgi:hypothetical protein
LRKCDAEEAHDQRMEIRDQPLKNECGQFQVKTGVDFSALYAVG